MYLLAHNWLNWLIHPEQFASTFKTALTEALSKAFKKACKYQPLCKGINKGTTYILTINKSRVGKREFHPKTSQGTVLEPLDSYGSS